MDELVLPFKRLEEGAIVPHYAHEGDSGMDIQALGAEPCAFWMD